MLGHKSGAADVRAKLQALGTAPADIEYMVVLWGSIIACVHGSATCKSASKHVMDTTIVGTIHEKSEIDWVKLASLLYAERSRIERANYYRDDGTLEVTVCAAQFKSRAVEERAPPRESHSRSAYDDDDDAREPGPSLKRAARADGSRVIKVDSNAIARQRGAAGKRGR